MTKKPELTEEQYRRNRAIAQSRLTAFAGELLANLNPLDAGGYLVAAGFTVLAQQGGEDFAAGWIRGLLEEREKSERSGEAWPSSHGHA